MGKPGGHHRPGGRRSPFGPLPPSGKRGLAPQLSPLFPLPFPVPGPNFGVPPPPKKGGGGVLGHHFLGPGEPRPLSWGPRPPFWGGFSKKTCPSSPRKKTPFFFPPSSPFFPGPDPGAQTPPPGGPGGVGATSSHPPFGPLVKKAPGVGAFLGDLFEHAVVPRPLSKKHPVWGDGIVCGLKKGNFGEGDFIPPFLCIKNPLRWRGILPWKFMVGRPLPSGPGGLGGFLNQTRALPFLGPGKKVRHDLVNGVVPNF